MDPRVEPLLAAQGLPTPSHPPYELTRDRLSFMRVVVLVSVREGVPPPEFLTARLDANWKIEEVVPGEETAYLARVEAQLPPIRVLCQERTPRMF
jgi:hypothetical protein